MRKKGCYRCLLNPLSDLNQLSKFHIDASPDNEVETLLSATRKFTTILDSITDGFYIVNKEWVVTYWNKVAEQLSGFTKAEALGKDIWQLFPGAVSLKYYPEYQRAVTEQIPVHFEEQSSVKDIWLDVNAYPSEEGLSVYFKDVTARKQAEEQLRIANERYEIVTRVTQDAI